MYIGCESLRWKRKEGGGVERKGERERDRGGCPVGQE